MQGVLHRAITHYVSVEALGNLALDTVKGTTADEEDILRVYGNHLLVGVLTSALGRYVHYRTFEELEQALLYALTADVACDRGVVALACNLVNLIDEYDASLSSLHVIVGYLEQTGEDALDVFAHVTCLGEYRSVYDGEGYLEELGDGACQEGLTCTCATYDDDVALLDLYVVSLVLL